MGPPQCGFSHELKDDLSVQKPYCSDYNCMAAPKCVQLLHYMASPQCGFSHELLDDL